MPETYIEPMTNRQECFQCHKTVTGKKKLSKCAGCHAITYCGVECQREDFPRHKWNCLPVMVTEIPGKGRGLVAARDIKMGELIFKDKAYIKIRADYHCGRPGSYTNASLLDQIENLPSEGKLQFYKLEIPYLPEDLNKKMNGHKELLIVLANGTDDEIFWRLHLNIALINHSCAPNAAKGLLQPEAGDDESDTRLEIRAIKDILKGEEITIFYDHPKNYRTIALKEERKNAFREMGFHCKCNACSGEIESQDEIVKEFLRVHAKLYPDPEPPKKGYVDWAQESKYFERYAELSLRTDIGRISDKTKMLDLLVIAAHMARDQDLLKKAMAMWKEVIENTKLEELRKPYEDAERKLSQWTKNLKSKKSPKRKEEISFMGRFLPGGKDFKYCD